jgi:hypothetical protein
MSAALVEHRACVVESLVDKRGEIWVVHDVLDVAVMLS